MWLIPGKTKIRLEIFKGVGLVDIGLGAFTALLLALMLNSNIPYHYIVSAAILFIAALLLARVDDEPNYLMIIRILNSLAIPSHFDKGEDKGAQDIEDLIAFTGISNGRINYGGEYMGAVIEITSVNFRLFTRNRKNNTIINGLGAVLRNLNLEHGANIVKIDRPVHYDDYLAKEHEKIEDLRKAFENAQMNEEEFKSRAEVAYERIDELEEMNDNDMVVIPFYYLVLFDSDVRQLENEVSTALQAMSSNDITARRLLDSKELAVFLKYTNTADVDETELDTIDPAEYAYWAMPERVDFKVRTVTTDHIVNHIMRVMDFPSMADDAWLASAMTIPGTKVVVKCSPMDMEKAIRNIDHSLFELQAQLNETSTQSKIIELTSHIESLSQLLVTLKGENEILLNTNVYVTAYDVVASEKLKKSSKKQNKKNNKKKNKDIEEFDEFENVGDENGSQERENPERIPSVLPRITNMKRTIRRTYAEHNMKVRGRDFQQFQMFVGSQVSGYDPLLNEARSIPSNSVAACYPWVFATISDENGTKLGSSENVPVFMDFFRRDSERVNSNMIIVGKSGSGKSYATKGILTNLAADNAKIFILDPENEYSELAANLHGKFINVGNAQFGRLNPFQIMTALDDDEVGTETVSGSYATHLQFLEEFFRQIMPDCDRDSLEYLNMIVERMYLEKGINAETNLSLLKPSDYPIFDDLYDSILREFQKTDNQYIRTMLRTLINYISKFAAGGRNSNIWDGPSTITTDENFTVFNFQSLLSNRNESIANAQMLLVLKYVDNEIIKNRDYNMRYGQDRKIVVVIDEAHVFIDTKFPVALDFMFQLAKRIRKYNGMQIVITQNIKDFVGSPEIARKSSAIINASQYSLIFSLAPNDLGDLCTLYEKAGGINEVEQDAISTAPRGQAFAVLGPLQRSTFQIEMPDQVVKLFSKRGAEGRNFSSEEGQLLWDEIVGTSRDIRMDTLLERYGEMEEEEETEQVSAVHFTELTEEEAQMLEEEEAQRASEIAAIAAQENAVRIQEAQAAQAAAAAETARLEAQRAAEQREAERLEAERAAEQAKSSSLEQALQVLASDNMELRIQQAVAAEMEKRSGSIAAAAAADAAAIAAGAAVSSAVSKAMDRTAEEEYGASEEAGEAYEESYEEAEEENYKEASEDSSEESGDDITGEDMAEFDAWMSELGEDDSDDEDDDAADEGSGSLEGDSDDDFDILSLLNAGAKEMEQMSAIEQMDLYDEEVADISLDDLMKYLKKQKSA